MYLHAGMIIVWSMKPTLARELVVDALLIAPWRRNAEAFHPQRSCWSKA
jgi:hypothetical protein